MRDAAIYCFCFRVVVSCFGESESTRMAGTAKASAAKKSAPPAKLGKAPAKTASPAKPKPAAKTKVAAPEKTSATAAVSLKQMAAGLAESHNLPKRQVEAMLGEFVQIFAEHLT